MNCILCGSQAISLVREVDIQILRKRWQTEFGINIDADSQEVLNFLQRHCNRCKLDFFDPLRPGSAAIYKQLEAFDWYYMADKWEYHQALQDLSGCSPAVEIGCGYGYFVDRVQKILKQEIHGIDINPDAVRFAQAKHWSVDQISLIELTAQKKGRYQAVCAFQVLEHIEDPFQFMKSCCDLLSPGGRLILAVPNGKGFQFRLDLLLDMPPHHLSIWAPETFKKLSNFFPLELVKLEYEPLPLYHLNLWLRSSFTSIPTNGLVFRLLRELMTVFINIFPTQKLFKGMGLYAVLVKH